MKKSISLAALIAVSSLFIVGCSKDDTEAPIISLIGSNPFQLEMLQTYSEPGATAEDNEDGDISSSINVNDTLIENRVPGTYNVYYSVSDAAGNQGTNSREIVVYATNNAMVDSYSVIDICGTGAAADTFLYQQNNIFFGFVPYFHFVSISATALVRQHIVTELGKSGKPKNQKGYLTGLHVHSTFSCSVNSPHTTGAVW